MLCDALPDFPGFPLENRDFVGKSGNFCWIFVHFLQDKSKMMIYKVFFEFVMKRLKGNRISWVCAGWKFVRQALGTHISHNDAVRFFRIKRFLCLFIRNLDQEFFINVLPPIFK